MPVQPITMPKWGLAMQEGTLAKWAVAEGSPIRTGQEIADIETTKIANVYESPVEGILRKRIAQEGEILPVGALLAVVADQATPQEEIDRFVADFLANHPEEHHPHHEVESDESNDGEEGVPAPDHPAVTRASLNLSEVTAGALPALPTISGPVAQSAEQPVVCGKAEGANPFGSAIFGSSGKFVLFLEDEAMLLMNGRGIIA